MNEIELEQASRLVRRYADFGIDVWPLFPDDAVPMTEAHRRAFARLWWRHKQAAPSIDEIKTILERCSISGLTSDGVELLRDKLAILQIPRWDDQDDGPLGRVPNWPQEVLRRRLPEVANAAADFCLDATAAAAREAHFLRKAVEIMDPEGNIKAPVTSRLILARKRADAIIELMNAIEQLQQLLPPPVPRKFAPWHEDARFLAEALSRVAEEAGISIGLSRADARGVRLVAMILDRLGIASPTPNAVAHVLRPGVAD